MHVCYVSVCVRVCVCVPSEGFDMPQWEPTLWRGEACVVVGFLSPLTHEVVGGLSLTGVCFARTFV